MGRGRGGWSPGPGPRRRRQGPAARRPRPRPRRQGPAAGAAEARGLAATPRPRSSSSTTSPWTGGPRAWARAARSPRRRRRPPRPASRPRRRRRPRAPSPRPPAAPRRPPCCPRPRAGRRRPRACSSPPRPPPPGLGLGLGLGLDGQRQRRRVASQRCSLEFLEDAVGCASVQRIVLICAKRSLCAAFSVLPYGEGLRVSDLRVDSQKQRHPSGGVSVPSEMVFELEGVELGADGKVVSYAKFLYPTNALVTHKTDGHGLLPQSRPSVPRALPGSRYKPAPAKAAAAGPELGADVGDALEYNPNLLDDPQWPCGKHKRVLIFASYMTTVIEYVKPSDLKKDMNETFREKFPHIKLTLSKIRSLKREMRNLSEECSLEPVTVSMAYVYFEKLVLQGKLNKQNRKLCAGACVLLAAKISSDLRKNEVKQLIDKLEERFRFNRRDLIGFEFTVLVALELALYLPENQVLPHYRRLTQQF
uniref:Cdk5 and Abl enzyme substrate 2 n=1 Tax=Equus asinus TaxID=9793 RepID=A0A9L0JMT1_EQUAS